MKPRRDLLFKSVGQGTRMALACSTSEALSESSRCLYLLSIIWASFGAACGRDGAILGSMTLPSQRPAIKHRYRGRSFYHELSAEAGQKHSGKWEFPKTCLRSMPRRPKCVRHVAPYGFIHAQNQASFPTAPTPKTARSQNKGAVDSNMWTSKVSKITGPISQNNERV